MHSEGFWSCVWLWVDLCAEFCDQVKKNTKEDNTAKKGIIFRRILKSLFLFKILVTSQLVDEDFFSNNYPLPHRTHLVSICPRLQGASRQVVLAFIFPLQGEKPTTRLTKSFWQSQTFPPWKSDMESLMLLISLIFFCSIEFSNWNIEKSLNNFQMFM